jgi:hypothetical protein
LVRRSFCKKKEKEKKMRLLFLSEHESRKREILRKKKFLTDFSQKLALALALALAVKSLFVQS